MSKRTDFSHADQAHDLRQPLNLIGLAVANARLILDRQTASTDREKVVAKLDTIDAQVKRIDRIINDLLDKKA